MSCTKKQEAPIIASEKEEELWGSEIPDSLQAISDTIKYKLYLLNLGIFFKFKNKYIFLDQVEYRGRVNLERNLLDFHFDFVDKDGNIIPIEEEISPTKIHAPNKRYVAYKSEITYDFSNGMKLDHNKLYLPFSYTYGAVDDYFCNNIGYVNPEKLSVYCDLVSKNVFKQYLFMKKDSLNPWFREQLLRRGILEE